jgi:hypothetical protein
VQVKGVIASPCRTGFGVLCAYAAVMIGFAAWRLRRADT